MIAEGSRTSPDVIPFPPLVFIAALGTGWLINCLVPFQLPAPLRVAGGILIFAGITLGMWGIRAMRRAGTPVRPDRPVTALVTDGPFQHTRNPLYIGLITIYLGIAFSTGILWLFVMLAPALMVAHWKIVRREEQFLEMKFGSAYRDYKARVRRWV